MDKLKQLIADEQPGINAVLQRLTDELPPMSRPVARHIFMAGGKRVRPLLTLFFGRLLGCHSDAVYAIIRRRLSLCHSFRKSCVKTDMPIRRSFMAAT